MCASFGGKIVLLQIAQDLCVTLDPRQ